LYGGTISRNHEHSKEVWKVGFHQILVWDDSGIQCLRVEIINSS